MTKNRDLPPENPEDLIARIFVYIGELLPDVPADTLKKSERYIRAEYSGEMTYIPRRNKAEQSQECARNVLALAFNGKNPTEIARRLGIGRTTVYRVLRQSGKN